MRVAAGLSQAQLAREAGVTRQAVISIEAGRYVPNTAVALRMAQRLACRVEDLFSLAEATRPARVTVWEPGGEAGGRGGACGAAAGGGARVTIARIRGALVAHLLPPSRPLFEGFAGADGVILARARRAPGMTHGRTGAPGAPGALARLLVPPDQLERTAVVLGCDPSLEIVSAHVSRRAPGHRLVCVPAGSRAALEAVRAGAAHVAGSHLRGKARSDDNVAEARRALAGTGGLVVALAAWEQGLIVARGNPHRIRGVEDLARRGIRFVNREPGAGCRAMLDERMASAGVPADEIDGYEREVRGHMAAAHAVACGGADAGLGIRAAACALSLDFVPMGHVRFDLVVPSDHADHPVVSLVLDMLNGRSLRDDLSSLPGYDVSRTGSVVAEVLAAAARVSRPASRASGPGARRRGP
jgi:molybdate-binding protein/DNA-binding XRE family transcriptional regulator